MKKYSLAFFIFSVLFITVFSCKKINEATDLGGGLIPGVDNVNTFEVALNTITDNKLYNDTVRVGYSDAVALGDVNDPVFGQTHANLAFTITPAILGINPFRGVDSVVSIDSVVLSLGFRFGWGDTLNNGVQTLRVYEISQTSGFRDDTVYRYNDPASDFTTATTGTELGSKTYTIKNLDDSIRVRNPGDTADTKVANVVRIRLNNSIGQRFSTYDTSSSTTTGGFHADGTQGSIFRDLFKGFAIKAENTGNALAYFSLSDVNKTKLIVYYKVKNNGDTIATATEFNHRSNGRANYIKVTPGGLWSPQLANGTSDSLLFIQTSPSGSYASVVIPGLTNFGNKVVHLAEIIAPIPTPYQPSLGSAFTPPSRLFLDRKRDTAFYLFERDIPVDFNGSLSLQTFGGALKSNAYRFNITRYVQNIITRGDSNDTLRLYAPYRTRLAINQPTNLLPEVGILDRPAGGRVVIGGGTYSDSLQRLRLRIIYSNL